MASQEAAKQMCSRANGEKTANGRIDEPRWVFSFEKEVKPSNGPLVRGSAEDGEQVALSSLEDLHKRFRTIHIRQLDARSLKRTHTTCENTNRTVAVRNDVSRGEERRGVPNINRVRYNTLHVHV